MLPTFEAPRDETNGQRVYNTPHGRFPSVTSILSATKDKSFLRRWKAKVGAVEAERIRNEAAKRGNGLHAMVETYLQTGAKGDGPWWDSIWPFLSTITATHLIEGPVWHPLGFAGTADFLGDVKGITSGVDWKTARSVRKKAWVEDYKLQATAYTGAANFLYEEHGFKAKQSIVVVALEDRPAQVFVSKRKAMITQWGKFGQRIDGYHKAMREFTTDLFAKPCP